MTQNSYNPDVLTCLANLSNDEVFTPPSVVNAMLDLLPEELWSDPNATFLDPVSKTGVFLREMAKRLMEGLAGAIPDQQARINHIFTRQLFALPITSLTALVSRRSVYCSKTANGKYSVCSEFGDEQGNIRFTPTRHTWSNGKCVFCGASESVFGNRGDDLESHAYQFIHTQNPENIFNMKFDVIIGNPPYQLEDGGGTGSSAIPLYHIFIETAKKLNPRFLTMIIPARWYSGGKGLDEFRVSMLNDKRLSHLVDYFDSADCFPGIDLSGGVCYFLWQNNYKGDCEITSNINGKSSTLKRPLLEKGCNSFIRFNEAVQIYTKIRKQEFVSFESIVSARKPFGDLSVMKTKSKKDDIYTFAYPNNGYTNRNSVTQGNEYISQHKVFISKAYGERGEFPYLVLGKPFIGFPETCCTETYLMIGPASNEDECNNIISYIHTKLFRFLVLFKKNTQNAAKGVYSFVPLQDFSEAWTDEKLYEKYDLTADEIAFIESMIRPME